MTSEYKKGLLKAADMVQARADEFRSWSKRGSKDEKAGLGVKIYAMEYMANLIKKYAETQE